MSTAVEEFVDPDEVVHVPACVSQENESPVVDVVPLSDEIVPSVALLPDVVPLEVFM